MKYLIKPLTAVLVLLCIFSGCSGAAGPSEAAPPAWDLAGTEPTYVTAWPENEYTAQVTKPVCGEMDYIYDCSEAGRYALFLKNITRDEAAAYVRQLEEKGYAQTAAAENKTAVGTMLKRGGTTLSISYSGEVFAMLITLEGSR